VAMPGRSRAQRKLGGGFAGRNFKNCHSQT
jgi:hypothetical protein